MNYFIGQEGLSSSWVNAMYVSEILIENFRLFKEFALLLNPGLNVIVGENNSGKTALIDAIRYTLDTNSAEWTRLSESDFHADAVHLKIRLKFEDIISDQAHAFVEHLTHEPKSEDRRDSVLYVNLIANLTNDVRRGSRYIRTELRSGENAEGPTIIRKIREYLSATYLKPLRDAEEELSAGRGSRLAQILSSSSEMNKSHNFEKLLTDFIKANQDAKGNPGISKSKDSIKSHFGNLTFEDDKEKFNIAVQILGSKDFAQMSDGEKQRSFQDVLARLSLVLDETTPRQGLGYNNVLFMATELILLEQELGQCPLLLIEEPEAHLHPQLQMKLLKFIRDEFSSEVNPRLQTILTTHSPNLASKAPLESLIITKNGKAFPLRKKVTVLKDDDYEFLEKFLDVTKSNLFFAKAVLIVEGDAENILLPTIARLLGRPLENYGVSIVNVGNTAYARYAKIFMRKNADENSENWIPIKVACLRDLDLWPNKADEEIFPGIGHKKFKERNAHYWEQHDRNGNMVGTDPNLKKAALEKFLDLNERPDSSGSTPVESAEFNPQNVRVCVSEKWTFEYCLAFSGLAQLVFEALEGNSTSFEDLPEDLEERAIKLYGMIETKPGSKTQVAYRMASLLERDYGQNGRRESLRAVLPKYILDAIEHVTGPWPENLDSQPEEPSLTDPNISPNETNPEGHGDSDSTDGEEPQ